MVTCYFQFTRFSGSGTGIPEKCALSVAPDICPVLSTGGTISTLAWLTAGTSAVVCLGLAQTGRWGQSPHTSKKLNAVAMTTAVDHGKMVYLLVLAVLSPDHHGCGFQTFQSWRADLHAHGMHDLGQTRPGVPRGEVGEAPSLGEAWEVW